jgi:hypothetical protein
MKPTEPLKYLGAERVDTPAGRLDGALVVSPTHVTLGKLDGVLIDPRRRKVRYCVLDAGGASPRHLLLPLTEARLDRDHRTLEVEVEPDEIDKLDEVDPARLPRFGDDDLITALFHHAQ